MEKENLLFIAGAQKCGTSTLLKMLNCHPDIFLLYECFVNKDRSKYSHWFLRKYPDAQYIFQYGAPLEVVYRKLKDFLQKKGYAYKMVGDKIATIDMDVLEEIGKYKVVFTARNVRTWLCKGAIRDLYHTNNDIVYPAISYCKYFLKSFSLKNCAHVRMEDTVYNNDKVIEKLSKFVGLEMTPYLDSWWEKGKDLNENDPKSVMDIKRVHPSASIMPKEVDTQVKLKQLPFWDKLLPIFDKYYNQIDHAFDLQEINRDIESLESLKQFSPVPLKEAYESYTSIDLEPRKKLNPLKRGLRWIVVRICKYLDINWIKLGT